MQRPRRLHRCSFPSAPNTSRGAPRIEAINQPTICSQQGAICSSRSARLGAGLARFRRQPVRDFSWKLGVLGMRIHQGNRCTWLSPNKSGRHGPCATPLPQAGGRSVIKPHDGQIRGLRSGHDPGARSIPDAGQSAVRVSSFRSGTVHQLKRRDCRSLRGALPWRPRRGLAVQAVRCRTAQHVAITHVPSPCTQVRRAVACPAGGSSRSQRPQPGSSTSGVKPERRWAQQRYFVALDRVGHSPSQLLLVLATGRPARRNWSLTVSRREALK